MWCWRLRGGDGVAVRIKILSVVGCADVYTTGLIGLGSLLVLVHVEGSCLQRHGALWVLYVEVV